MSEIKLNLLDSQFTLIATVHGSVGDRLVAALSAEPETIDELEAALHRFEKWESFPASSLHRSERREIDEEPYDAGILVIDLAARVVACESTYSLPVRDGIVEYHNGQHCTGFPLGYRLPDDWLFLRSIDEYQVRAEQRRQERAAVVPLDARIVLYGTPLLDFIIQNVQLLNVRASDVRYAPDVRYALACRDSPNTQLEKDSSDLACRDSSHTQPAANLLPQAVVDIHRRWLMTPRDDLNRQSPREILFEKRDLIDFDLNSRVNQWSYFLEEPPSLSRDSHAYRFAGFGTHEWVMYYKLVRFLIWETVDRMVSGRLLEDRVSSSDEPFLPSPCTQFSLSDDRLSFTSSFSLGSSDIERPTTVSTVSNQQCLDARIDTDSVANDEYHAALIKHLEELKLTWLTEPNPDLDGYLPFEVIDNERRRRPEAMTGRSMVVDEECPCCKMMGDQSEAGLEICFCHFDGCNMEDEFVFSGHATIEKWEEEQREWAELDREWKRKEAERKERIARGELVEDADFDVPF